MGSGIGAKGAGWRVQMGLTLVVLAGCEALGGKAVFCGVEPGDLNGRAAGAAGAPGGQRARAQQPLGHGWGQRGVERQQRRPGGRRRVVGLAQTEASVASPASAEGRSAGVRKRSIRPQPGSIRRQGTASENSVKAAVG